VNQGNAEMPLNIPINIFTVLAEFMNKASEGQNVNNGRGGNEAKRQLPGGKH
jgi:hypothetical protein